MSVFTVAQLIDIVGPDWRTPLQALSDEGLLNYKLTASGSVLIEPAASAEISEMFAGLCSNSEEVKRTKWQI